MRSERKQDKCNTTKIRPQSQPTNTVKTSIIRDAVLKYIDENETSLAEVAYKANWRIDVRGVSRGDGTRLRRTLGMRPDGNPDYRYTKKYRQYMFFKTAITIIRAIDRSPWEFDI